MSFCVDGGVLENELIEPRHKREQMHRVGSQIGRQHFFFSNTSSLLTDFSLNHTLAHTHILSRLLLLNESESAS